ncbi:Serine/arginine repetitive matrix protein 2 [Rhodotorula toruloides ATCC 204091]|uniref:Serine/arginine repetitive matrix protein 2 n=2 Tax=Rhodotorula toruloides TaxID=5286 RepID=A0A2T0A7I5_RHOTO|nr:Serine/arginine repetitive matrix protein 2 [Rhodotorula toruloides ATCC 204091]KAK4332707.1 Serine/arginine repetitive matrix protein 2 [Rhodotorula toruloides]PRQ73991.1 Serine/arginine repetitive matrix protein 2 [Rhodotorula toruloides]
MAARASFPRLAQTFADKQVLLRTVQEACDNSNHTFSVTASTDRIVTFRCSSRRRGDRDACTAHLTARRAETKAPWAVTEVNNRHSCTVPPTPVPKPVVHSKKRPPSASTAKIVDTSPALADVDEKPSLRPSTPFKLVYLSDPSADDAQGPHVLLDAAPPSPIFLRTPDTPAPPAKKRRRSVAAGAARKSAQKPPAPVSTANSSSSPPLPILDIRTPSPPPPPPQSQPSTLPLVSAATPFSLLLAEVGFSDPNLVASLLYLDPATLRDFLAQVKVEYGEETRKRMSDFVLSWREMGRREGFG